MPAGRIPLSRASTWRRSGFAWVTGLMFAIWLAGHWTLARAAYAEEQRAHGEEPEVAGYLTEVGRDTLENQPSEFLRLIRQVAGLALLPNVGSHQSREEDDRLKGKIDAIVRAVNLDEAERIIRDLDGRFDRGEASA